MMCRGSHLMLLLPQGIKIPLDQSCPCPLAWGGWTASWQLMTEGEKDSRDTAPRYSVVLFPKAYWYHYSLVYPWCERWKKEGTWGDRSCNVTSCGRSLSEMVQLPCPSLGNGDSCVKFALSIVTKTSTWIMGDPQQSPCWRHRLKLRGMIFWSDYWRHLPSGVVLKDTM